MTIQTFAIQQANFARRIDDVLEDYLKSLPESALSQAMQYSLLAGGKRVRPFLVYATGQMFGVPLEKLDAPAAALEAIHTYSLIHDDLPAMDNDELRRGKATCHIKYGEANAILAGDALQSLAFKILSTAPEVLATDKLDMITELANASGAQGMCIGQVYDLESEQRQINVAQLNTIHHYKTGMLIRAAVRLGLYSAGASFRVYQPILDKYAEAIGLAFQVQDDILDVVGDQMIMGKPQGSDMALAKCTYPALLGLKEAKKVAYTLYQQANAALNQLPYNSDLLQQLANFIIQRDK